MKIINKIMYVITMISIILLSYFVTTLNVLPKKYYIPFIIIMVIWAILLTFINIKAKKKLIKILTLIVMILSIILNSVGIYYVYNTNKFFQRLSDVIETKQYYVVVKKDSKYEKLKDLKNKKIGLFDTETKNYKNDKVDSILINSNVKEILD